MRRTMRDCDERHLLQVSRALEAASREGEAYACARLHASAHPARCFAAELGVAAEAPPVAIAAGVHGDEPAGAWALLELVAEAGALDPFFRVPFLALYEPDRFRCRHARERGRRRRQSDLRPRRTIARSARHHHCKSRPQVRALTRFARGGADAVGFYCYEYGGGDVGTGGRRRARGCRAADRSARRNVRHGRAPQRWGGTARANADASPPITADRGRRSSAVYRIQLAIARNAARHTLTFETPAGVPWETRLAMMRTAVRKAQR